MKEKLSLPVSIVIAGVFIALAIIFTGSGEPSTNLQDQQVNNDQNSPQVETENSLNQVAEVTAKDHIRGSRNAVVKIIEYSDFECPFCKSFHNTMNQVMSEHGDNGQVAWVYRHFPLDSLHPEKARLESVISECVTELGGNDAFWAFADAFFVVTPSNNRTDLDTVIPKIISDLGLSQEKIDECVTSGRYNQAVQDDIDNAIATGGQGTPWSVVVTSNGKQFPLSGAQPYSAVKALINIALEETK